MNKTQINFFCERADIIKKRVRHNHEMKYLPVEDLSIGQMANKIYNGEAKFKIELFEYDACPRVSGCSTRYFLEQFFDIPELDEIKSKRARREEILKQISKRIDLHADELKEDFVMKEIADPREALKRFEEMNFFTITEEYTLAKIAIKNEDIN